MGGHPESARMDVRGSSVALPPSKGSGSAGRRVSTTEGYKPSSSSSARVQEADNPRSDDSKMATAAGFKTMDIISQGHEDNADRRSEGQDEDVQECNHHHHHSDRLERKLDEVVEALKLLTMSLRPSTPEVKVTKEILEPLVTTPVNSPTPPVVVEKKVHETNDKEEWSISRLQKAIKLQKFDPPTEEEFEDVLEEWESQCHCLGIDRKHLCRLAVQLASPIVRTSAMSIPVGEQQGWIDFKNALARVLYPYSTYPQKLEEQLLLKETMLSLREAVQKVDSLNLRYAALCIRWKRPNLFYDHRLKEALVGKLPQRLAQHAMACNEYVDMTYAAFVKRCYLLANAFDINTAEAPVLSGCAVDVAAAEVPDRAPVSVDSREHKRVRSEGSMSTTPSTEVGKKGRGHKDDPKKKPRPKCSTCGKAGHTSAYCYKLPADNRFGGQRSGFVRMTRGRVLFDLNDDRSTKAMYDAIKRHLDKNQAATERALEKAKERRKRKKEEAQSAAASSVEEQSEGEAGSEQSEEVEANPMEVDTLLGEAGKILQPLGVVSHLLRGSHYVALQVNGKKFPALLDSGAVVSLFPQHEWEHLPEQFRKSLATSKVGGHRELLGLGGSVQVYSVVNMPVQVRNQEILQRFFITPSAMYPILGMDALSVLDCVLFFKEGKVLMGGLKCPTTSSAMIIPPIVQTVTVGNESEVCVKGGRKCLAMEIEDVKALLKKFGETWKPRMYGTCLTAEHRIELTDGNPISSKPRRLNPVRRAEVRRMVQALLDDGAIRKSQSEWASPIVLVPKSNGTTRMCIDFRLLNQVTKRDLYPLPRITELLDKLGGFTIFSTLDLRSGYYQIKMHPDSQEKTAFITPDGLYEFLVMPFGLTNAPATFQRAMDGAFQNSCYNRQRGIYLDDIVLCANSFEEHQLILTDTLERLQKAGFVLNLDKSIFCSREAKYLGFWIGEGTITPDKEQTAALYALRAPTSVSEVRRLLGLVGYFRQFIPNFAAKAKPISRLLHKDVPFQWTSECQKAWEELRGDLNHPNVRLILPQEGQLYVLDTDASGYALGAVLMQRTREDQLRPLMYLSRLLTPTEQAWTTQEREAFAVVWAVLKCAPYLRDEPHFIVRTDYKSLRWLWSAENKKIIRWALALQEFSFTIHYQAGTSNSHADIFSRIWTPPSSEDVELTDRISLPAAVMVIQGQELSVRFPSKEELRAAQTEECTPEVIQKYGLIQGADELWVNCKHKIYVPLRYRNLLMYFFHFSKHGAHMGANKTVRRLTKWFYWPEMQATVLEYLKHCLTCLRKRPAPQVLGRGHLLAAEFNITVAMDVVGPLRFGSTSVQLLTVIDHFSRYPWVGVIPDITSETIWAEFAKQWITYFGAPSYLLTDNATCFTSAVFGERCKEYGISWIHPLPYHPEGNGLLEAFHQYLKRSLFAIMRTTSWSLNDALPVILLAYRSTPHLETGETPQYLVTGTDTVLPGLQEWRQWKGQEQSGYRKYRALKEIRRDIFEKVARRAVERSLKKNKNKTSNLKELVEGQLILYYLSPVERGKQSMEVGGRKSIATWSGPCRILHKDDRHQDAYWVQHLWNEKKTLVYQESIITLPSNWTKEHVQLAVNEMVSDWGLFRPAVIDSKRVTKLRNSGRAVQIRTREELLPPDLQNTAQKLQSELLISTSNEEQGRSHKRTEFDQKGGNATKRRRDVRTPTCVSNSEISSIFFKSDLHHAFEFTDVEKRELEAEDFWEKVLNLEGVNE